MDLYGCTGHAREVVFRAALGVAACLSIVEFSTAASPVQVSAETHQHVNQTLGLRHSELFWLDVDDTPGIDKTVTVPINGQPHTLLLTPYSVRADGYQLRVQLGDGSIEAVEPGPVRTYRGSVVGVPDSLVAASIAEGRLTATIFTDGDRFTIDSTGVLDVAPQVHMVYHEDDVIDPGGACGVQHQAQDLVKGAAGGGVAGAGGLCIAELACDADVEYFQDYGSVTGVENRINLIINTVNTQYENQVNLTHTITDILVRTAEPDPYSSSNSGTLLDQFQNEWFTNQGAIQRDLAHLFTGKELNGDVIGIAWTIGSVCSNFSSYCLSQSDFNNVFSCATDLTAHELGHLWDASHCNCPSNTMNSFITCANSFSAASINSISSYASTLACLDGACDGQVPGCGDPGTGSCTAANGTPYCDDLDCCELICGADAFCCDTEWDQICADAAIADCSGAPTGACCFDDGSCTNGLSESACGGQGGTYAGDGSNCATANCPQPPTGSCCFVSGACSDDQTESQCNDGGGDWQGDGSTCATVQCPLPPGTGACCLAGQCADGASPNQCAAQGGVYQGDETTCADVDCTVLACGDPAAGDCTVANGSPFCNDLACCLLICTADPFCCTNEWDQVCADAAINDCFGPPTGACCFDDGSCTDDLTESACGTEGGTYAGDDSTCVTANCPQPPATGACCFDNGSCTDGLTASACGTEGGTYAGDDSTCITANCPQPPATGACCFGDGSCTDGLTESACGTQGGTYAGDDSTCATANCPGPPTGACCFGDGSCEDDLTGAKCSGQGGSYQGSGSTCAAVKCPGPPTGACCLADRSCLDDQTTGECDAAGGTYEGNSTACSDVDCTVLGCGDAGTGDCTVANGSPFCDDAACCELICAADAFCCDTEWDQVCADAAIAQCVGEPTGACCLGDFSCVDGVTAADCGGQGGDYQGDGLTCGAVDCNPPVGCGDPLSGDCNVANGSPFCDDEACCELICAADAFCCDTEWDQIYADAAIAGCGVTGPGNDDCEDAVEILNGDTAYSTVGSTNDGPDLPGVCDKGYGVDFGSDIWYLYTPKCNGTLTVSTCDQADYDTRLAAYTGSCGALAFAACNDDGPDCAGFTSILEVAVSCDVPVLIRVGGFGGAQGSGTLSVSCDGGPCKEDCAGDTNGDGTVDVTDLVNVVSLWGTDGQAPGVDADIEPDGTVDVLDLVAVISNWGPCK